MREKIKKLAKLEEIIRSVRSVYGNKNILIIGLEFFILSRVRTKVLASQTKILSFDQMWIRHRIFLSKVFRLLPSNNGHYDLFIETTDVGDLLTGAFVK